MPHDWTDKYNDLSQAVFGRRLPYDIRGLLLMSDFPEDSIWFKKCHEALWRIELEYVESLLLELKESSIQGSLVEFGIFQGHWINLFFDMTERLGFEREIWGFDSFKGLSKPHPTFDTSFWKEGMYTASRSEVETFVRASERPRIHLVEGFFSESLKQKEALNLNNICFARIDCDIYEPALECLDFLSSRLVDRSILVFDDWSFSPEVGETRAFFEWVSKVHKLKFEYLCSGVWGHIYFRVCHQQ